MPGKAKRMPDSSYGLVYLINTTSDASAGWYDPDVARVLLTESKNWETAGPDTSNLAEQPGQQETTDTDEDDTDPPTS